MKKNIFFFILGGIIFSTITGVVAYNYNAKDIEYSPSDNTWNVNNVEDAIKDLKDNKKIDLDLLWTNPNPTSSFSPQTINLDLSDYKWAIIDTRDSVKSLRHSIGLIKIGVGYSSGIGRVGGSTTVRFYEATTTGIVVSGDWHGSNTDGNGYVIPYKIYGVKENLNIDID